MMRMALLPYSIGHEIMLTKTSNPLATYAQESFAELEEPIQRAKLFSACFICKRSWVGNRRPIKWVALTIAFRQKCKTTEEVAKFQSYRGAGQEDFPTRRMPRTQGVPYHYFGAPAVSRLLLFVTREHLFRDFGFETPFDFPMALARQLYSADMEARENLWVENWHDAEEKERAKKFEKLHPENTLALGDDAVNESMAKWNAEHPDSPINFGGKNG